ncbi:hypothetical protein PQQ96_01945 [Paraburkholderia sediminicola]|uniref:hypothetical protein n=1 Tax=Paraburkholderia sediminicola TaxID=458836 RepID=UPI0038BB7FF3
MSRFQSQVDLSALIKCCGAAAIVLLLGACGGGSSDGPKSDASTPPAASQPGAGASTPAVSKSTLHCAP